LDIIITLLDVIKRTTLELKSEKIRNSMKY